MRPKEGSFFNPSDGLAKSDTESVLKLLQTDAYRRAKPRRSAISLLSASRSIVTRDVLLRKHGQ
jgi:hypothetical protein